MALSPRTLSFPHRSRFWVALLGAASLAAVIAVLPGAVSAPRLGSSDGQSTESLNLTTTTNANFEVVAIQPPAPEAAAPVQTNDAPPVAAAQPAASSAAPAPVAAAPSAPTPAPVTAKQAVLSVPDGYSVYVSATGCAPNGACPYSGPANYYWAPTRTAVVYTNQSAWTIQHEGCHAHQHLAITRELGVEPQMPFDLHEWLMTREAATWNSMVTSPWPGVGQWAREPGAHNAVEDFGISCGLYFSDPQQLQQIDPARYAAVVAVLS